MTELETSAEEIISSLSKVRSFSQLTKDKLQQLASLGEFRQFPRGTTILAEGENNNDVFFLLKGSVSVYSGGKFVSRYGRAGDIFGEMSVVSGTPVSASVVTNETVEAMVIDGDIMGGFKSSQDHEWVTVFYKLFSLSLLEKLKLTTLKARLYEDSVRHNQLNIPHDEDSIFNKPMEARLSETLITSLAIHTAEQAIVVADTDGRIVRFNLAAENLFSMIELQMLGKHIEVLCEMDGYAPIFPTILDGSISTWSGELNFIRGDKNIFPARTSLSTIQDHDGNMLGLLTILTDISREKLLEDQLRHSQKMEAIGQMAGSMAHDFNNILQIISGHLELAVINVEAPEKLSRDLASIRHVTERGSRLTKNLLGYSRNKSLGKKEIDLNDVLTTMSPMLRVIIDSRINFDILTHENLWRVHADPNHMEQVLTNLCINARDAMPKGGTLILKTGNVEFDQSYCNNHLWARQGEHVILSVTDTGEGMDAGVLSRIFEPFFSTKELHQGTGLGLSMVLGIIEDHGGFIHAESRPGEGTSISVYLPKVG